MSKQALFEALDWAIFTFGGTISSFFLPANIVITLILGQPIPNGALIFFPSVPLVKIYLFLLLGGAAWQSMHRIRFVLFGLGLSGYRKSITGMTTAALALILVFAFRTVFGV